MIACVREMVSADLEMVLTWRNDPHVRQFMLNQNSITFDEHEKWFENNKGRNDRIILIYEQDKQPLGYIHFSAVAQSSVYDWGFYTAPKAPKGTGRNLGKTALDHLFSFPHISKVCGQVISFNQRSLSFHERLGFIREGLLRQQFTISDQTYDMVLYGLLRSEWKL